MSSGTCSRHASSRARWTETPRASPVFGSCCASTVLPKLIAARSVPFGASSLTMYIGAKPTERQEERTSSAASIASLLVKLGSALLHQLRPFRQVRGHEAAEFPGRAADRLAAVGGDAALHVGQRQRADQLVVQALHQRRRHAGRAD